MFAHTTPRPPAHLSQRLLCAAQPSLRMPYTPAAETDIRTTLNRARLSAGWPVLHPGTRTPAAGPTQTRSTP